MNFCTYGQWVALGCPGVLVTDKFSFWRDAGEYHATQQIEDRTVETISPSWITLMRVLGLSPSYGGTWQTAPETWRTWKLHKLSSKNETAKYSGVMIAFFYDPATAQQLAIPGGLPPEDLHVTLAFLGDSSELRSLGVLRSQLQAVAQKSAPISGNIGGFGRFTSVPNGVEHPLIALPDLPGLPAWRENMISHVRSAGFAPNEEHGFTPHTTLKYLAPNEETPIKSVPNLPLRFNTLWLAEGDERYAYPMMNSVQNAESLSA